MIKERLIKQPGFLYQIGNTYYYLGKWICKECKDIEATDCVMMYEICRSAGEESETGMYFQKIRAHSDFALDIPYNSIKIQDDITSLIERLSNDEKKNLENQLERFEIDIQRYC